MLQRIILAIVVLAIVIAGAVAFFPQLVRSEQAGGTASGAIPDTATKATVDYVHDGDTLFLSDGRKVRLLGINTPEIGDRAECYGEEATRELRELLPVGTTVWVVHDLEPFDQYGRSLLYVYTQEGLNVNLELLRRGAAEVEMYEPNVMLRDEIYAAQGAAQSADRGLWGVC